ncbi:MAG: hypothetical protein WDM90_19255 [Ferruginibacter sp.]
MMCTRYSKEKIYRMDDQCFRLHFSFATNGKPDLINVDGDKMLVCEKTDHKTAEQFIFQYKYAANYVDRREAIAYFINHKNEKMDRHFCNWH